MATSVPQFNLTEVNNALIKIIKNKEVNFDDIYCPPDFAQGGIIMNPDEVKESIKNGQGEGVRLRAKLTYNPELNMIEATEMPYGVFTNAVIEQLKKILDDNPDYGIEKVVDHTKTKADIYIYLSKYVNPNVMIKKLYNDTSLESMISINMVMLNYGRTPKIFGWREACDAYIEHIRKCRRNIAKFEYQRLEERKNVVEGLILASNNIDDIIKIIRASDNSDIAAVKLSASYSFNTEQIAAILAMKLSALTKLDVNNLLEEQKKLITDMNFNDSLIKEDKKLDAELIKILKDVIAKYGDERRTEIAKKVIDPEESENKVRVTLYNNNNICVFDESEKQDLKEVKQSITTVESDYIIVFTEKGKYYILSIDQLKKDKKIKSIFDSNIVTIYSFKEFSKNKYIIVCTKKTAKKIKISEFKIETLKAGCVYAMLDPDEVIVQIAIAANDEDYIFILTNLNNYSYYRISSLPSKTKTSKPLKILTKAEENEEIKFILISDSKMNKVILFYSRRRKIEKEIEEIIKSKKPKLLLKSDNEITAVKWGDNI